MQLVGLRLSEDKILVKYVYDSAIHGITYRGTPNVSKITKNSHDYIIMDDARSSWEWDIDIPVTTSVPDDLALDSYNYNTLLQVFEANTTIVSGDIVSYTKTVQIEVQSGTALLLRKGGLDIRSGHFTVSGTSVFGGNVTSNGKIYVNNNTPVGAGFARAAVTIGQNNSDATRGGLAVLGGVNIGQDLFVGRDASINGSLSVTGIAVLSSVSVSQDSTIGRNLTVSNILRSKTADITDTTEYTGGLTSALICAGGTLVNGNSCFKKNLNIDGTLYINDIASLSKIQEGLLLSASNMVLSAQASIPSYGLGTSGINILGKSNSESGISIDAFNGASTLIGRRDNSTEGIKNNDILLSIQASGLLTSSHKAVASINIAADEDWGASSFGTKMELGVTPKSGSSIMPMLRLSSSGVSCLHNLSISGTLSAPNVIDTDNTLSSDSDVKLPSTKAVKYFVEHYDDLVRKSNRILNDTNPLLELDYTDPTNTVNIYPREIFNSDFTRTYSVATILSKQLDSEFIEGNNSGMLAAGFTKQTNTSYSLYLIHRELDDVTDVIAFPSFESVVLPDGWNSYLYLGSVRTDGDANIISGIWERCGNDQTFYYTTPVMTLENVDVLTEGSLLPINIAINRVVEVFGEVSHGLADIEFGTFAEDSSAQSDLGLIGIAVSSYFLGYGIPLKNYTSQFRVKTNTLGEANVKKSGAYLDAASRTSFYVHGYREKIG